MTDENEVVVPTISREELDKEYERGRAEKRDAEWLRETALTQAINHHKHNGGLVTADQIVTNAKVFLHFLKGETQ